MLVGSSMYERFLPRGSFHVGFGFSAFHWLPPLDLEPERLPAEALVRVSPNAPSALSVAADSAPSEASAESTYDLGGVLPYMPHSPARPAWLQHAQASWGRWLECRAEEAAGPGASIVLAVPVFTHPRVPMPNSKASSASAEGAAESAPHSGAGADAQSDLPAELQRYAGEYIVVRDAALQAMAADGLLTARELAHMTPSAFLATPQELKVC